MLKMLVDVTTFLKANRLKYAVTFGTLLGAVRNQSIIPQTADIDLYLPEESREKLMAQKKIPYKFWMDQVFRGCADYPGVQTRSANFTLMSTSDNDRGTVPFYMIIYDDALLRYWGLEE